MKRLREQLGWSQAQLAEEADLSVQYVAALEQQSRSPALKTIDALCSALRVTPGELFTAGVSSKKSASRRAEDQLAHLLRGLTRRQQEAILGAVREMRKLVPRR